VGWRKPLRCCSSRTRRTGGTQFDDLAGLVTAGGLLPIRGWRLTCAPRATLLELVRHKRRGHCQRGRQTGISLHAKEKADHHLPRVTAVVRHIGHEMGTRAVTVRFAVTRMKTLDRKATEQVVRGSLSSRGGSGGCGLRTREEPTHFATCKPASVIVHGRTFMLTERAPGAGKS